MVDVAIDIINRINLLYNSLKCIPKKDVESALYFVNIDTEVKQLIKNVEEYNYDRYKSPTF